MFNINPKKNISKLVKATHHGDIELVKELLNKGIHPDGKNEYHTTAAEHATRRGDSKILELLLNAGADIQQKTSHDSKTLLTIIIETGLIREKDKMETLNLLIKKNININHISKSNRTPLMFAMEKEMFAIAAKLIQAGALLNLTTKHEHIHITYAARYNYIDLLHLMIDKGIDIDAKNKYGYTALAIAAERGNVQIFDFLITKSADINAKTALGSTPFICASYNNKTEIMRRIIDRKNYLGENFDIEEKNNKGHTALMEAANHGSTEAIRFIAEYGGNLDAVNKKGRTSLISATRNNYYGRDTLLLLIELGADLNIKDEGGMSALMHAVRDNNIEHARILLEAGADLESPDLDFLFTEEHQNTAMLDLIKKHSRLKRKETFPTKKVSFNAKEVEKWVMFGKDTVAQVKNNPQLKKRITEVFNFSMRKTNTISENLKEKTESLTQPVGFETIPKEALKKALVEFTKLGGSVDEDFILSGREKLKKNKLPSIRREKGIKND